MSGNHRIRGENRFYYPPPMRKLQQEREEREKKGIEEENEEKKRKMKGKEKQERQRNDRSRTVLAVKEMKKQSSEECSISDCTVSGRVATDVLSNLGRFLECTTPVVPAHCLRKRSIKGWRTRKPEYHPYFLLSDLWHSFEEWSAFGVGVPLLLNGSDLVVQYYVPSLSGIQLYEDPSRVHSIRRNEGLLSTISFSKHICRTSPFRRIGTRIIGMLHSITDLDFGNTYLSSVLSLSCLQMNPLLINCCFLPRDTSSNGSTDCQEISQNLNKISLEEKSFIGSSSEEFEIASNSPGHLVFKHLEEGSPFSREPLLEKILNLSLQFPALRTYGSCDLSSSSWLSVAWYPIYRIPVGHTLQNLDACFLKFHSLSSPSQGKRTEMKLQRSPNQSQFSLPTFGLASYKFKLSVWIPESGGFGSGTVEHEHQRVQTLLQAAQEWLGRLQVVLPDLAYFLSRNNSRWR